MPEVSSIVSPALVLLDAAGRVSSWSELAERLTGYSAAEITGAGLESLLAAAVPNPGLGGVVLRHKNGASVPVVIQVVARPGESGDGSALLLRAAVEPPNPLAPDAPVTGGFGARFWVPVSGKVWWSAEKCRLLGVPEGFSPDYEQFLGMIHPEDRPFAEAAIAGLRAGSDEYAHLVRMFRPDGSFLWVLTRGRPTRDANGNLVLLEGIVQDVTAAHPAKPAATDRELLLRELADNSSEVIWLREPATGKFLYMSPAFERIWGVPNRELYLDSQVWQKHLHPEDVPLWEAATAQSRAAAGTRFDPVEIRVVRPDGEVRWLAANPERPIFIEDSVPHCFAGSARDITARREAEVALLRSQQHLSAVVEAALDAILLADDEGRYVEVNAAACEMFGYTREEFLQLSVRDLLSEDDRPMFPAIWAAFLKAGQFRGRNRLVCRDGRILHTHARAHAHAMPGLHLSIVRDISDMVEAAEARGALEEELRQSQKLEAVGRLAGGVAHDFNNLLTVINGYSDLLLRDTPAWHPNRAMLTAIQHAGKRAAGLTQQLLAFGRKQILKAVPLDLNEVLARASAMFSRLIGEDVVISTRCGADLRRVWADAGQIERVILNLAVNARDAMPAGGLLLFETGNCDVLPEDHLAESGCPPGQYVRLRVADTGEGIPKAVLPKIFEPFFTTKELGHGTGLGLSVVHGIVSQSGGYIHVESSPGEGSRFDIYLPATTGIPEASGNAEISTEAPAGEGTILLVEDEQAVRDVTAQMLTHGGYRVVPAGSATEAIETADALTIPIDLLLTDVVMPGMGGGQLASILRQRRPGMRVLFMTGYSEEAVNRLGVLGIGYTLLTKPFSPADLLQAVRSACAHTSENDASLGKDSRT